MGEERLAQWLKSPAPLNAVRERQAGITDLKDRLDLREELAVIGEHANVGIHPEALLQWAETPNKLASPWIFWVAVLFPILAIPSGLYWAVTGIGSPFSPLPPSCTTAKASREEESTSKPEPSQRPPIASENGIQARRTILTIHRTAGPLGSSTES